MAEISKFLLKPLFVSTVLVVQGCATTDELFADYDDNFCHASDVYAEYLTMEEPASVVTAVRIKWEPTLSFRAGSSVLSEEGSQLIKENAKQLVEYPEYKIALESLSADEITDDFNRMLYNMRLESIQHLLVNVVGIDADKIVVSSLKQKSVDAAAGSDVEDIALVDIDRRISMTLLDENDGPVPLDAVKAVARNVLTTRPWAQARLPESHVSKKQPSPQPAKLPKVAVSKPLEQKPTAQKPSLPLVVLSEPVAMPPVAPKPVIPEPTLPEPARSVAVLPAPPLSVAALPEPARPAAALPEPQLPVAPTMPAMNVVRKTPEPASVSGMRTVVYERWTITEPASTVPTMPVITPASAPVAPVMPIAPAMPAPAPGKTISPKDHAVTNEVYTLEQQELVEEITRDFDSLRLTRPYGHSALDKIRRLKLIHPTHDYSVKGEMYIARILVMLGKQAADDSDLTRAKTLFARAIRVYPPISDEISVDSSKPVVNSSVAYTVPGSN